MQIAFIPILSGFARILNDIYSVIELYGIADCWAITDRGVNRRTKLAADSAFAGTWIPRERVAIINSQKVEGDLWRQLEHQTWIRSNVMAVHRSRCR